MSRRKKGESPSQYRRRRTEDDGRFPGQGIVEGLLGVGAVLVGVSAAVAEAEQSSQRRQLARELELEREQSKKRVIEQMASNFPSSSFETRETIKTRHLVQRLAEVNRKLDRLADQIWSLEKDYLEEEKAKLEDALGIG